MLAFFSEYFRAFWKLKITTQRLKLFIIGQGLASIRKWASHCIVTLNYEKIYFSRRDLFNSGLVHIYPNAFNSLFNVEFL